MKSNSRNKGMQPKNNGQRIASISLAICCLTPMIVVFTWLGIWLDQRIPEITLFMALAALPFMGLMIGVLMFMGAGLWLLLARKWVSRDTARRFFVVPGVGWFSMISYWLFRIAYGDDDKD